MKRQKKAQLKERLKQEVGSHVNPGKLRGLDKIVQQRIAIGAQRYTTCLP